MGALKIGWIQHLCEPFWMVCPPYHQVARQCGRTNQWREEFQFNTCDDIIDRDYMQSITKGSQELHLRPIHISVSILALAWRWVDGSQDRQWQHSPRASTRSSWGILHLVAAAFGATAAAFATFTSCHFLPWTSRFFCCFAWYSVASSSWTLRQSWTYGIGAMRLCGRTSRTRCALWKLWRLMMNESTNWCSMYDSSTLDSCCSCVLKHLPDAVHCANLQSCCTFMMNLRSCQKHEWGCQSA